jgi:hypothetical protein
MFSSLSLASCSLFLPSGLRGLKGGRADRWGRQEDDIRVPVMEVVRLGQGRGSHSHNDGDGCHRRCIGSSLFAGLKRYG